MQVYKTRGVCSQAIQFELDGDTIKHVNFIADVPETHRALHAW